jgi:hypothetical protein
MLFRYGAITFISNHAETHQRLSLVDSRLPMKIRLSLLKLCMTEDQQLIDYLLLSSGFLTKSENNIFSYHSINKSLFN